MTCLRMIPGLVVWVLSAGAALAMPRVLIVNQKVPPQDGTDINVEIASPLAEQIRQSRRLQPILWSLADPVFRDWVDQKWASDGAPTDKEMFAAAGKGKVDYVLVVTAMQAGRNVTGALVLYRGSGGKPIWRDTKSMQIEVGGAPNWDAAGMALAGSWMALLQDGPWRDIKPEAVLTPDRPADPPPTTPFDPPKTTPRREPAEFKKLSETQIRQGLVTEAILTLRSGVDENPESGELRQMLVELLVATGRHEMAAEEAERFSAFDPTDSRFLMVAAQTWIDLGQPERAQKLVNELRSRIGDSPELDVIQGQIAIANGDLLMAAGSFGAVAAQSKSYPATLGLALVGALQGDAEALQQALSLLGTLTDPDPLRSYRWAMRAIDLRMDALADQFREDLRFATAKPRTKEAVDRGQKAKSVSSTLATLMDSLKVPKNHTGSHERRRLAHRLLVQAASELAAFAASGDQDMGEEAAISLGEALRQLPALREEMQQEFLGK